MPTNKPERIVVKLGGSVLFGPTGVAVDYLQQVRPLFLKAVAAGHRFLIVVGGGKVCRIFQEAGKKLGVTDFAELDRIGIAVTRAQAELVRTSFGKVAHSSILQTFDDQIPDGAAIVVSGGTAPGWSTDYVACQWAVNLKAQVLVRASDAPFVYATDPRLDKTARPLEHLTWREYRANIAPQEWTPGSSSPFDPKAAALAESQGITLRFFDGRNLAAFEGALVGNSFTGTIMSKKR